MSLFTPEEKAKVTKTKAKKDAAAATANPVVSNMLATLAKTKGAKGAAAPKAEATGKAAKTGTGKASKAGKAVTVKAEPVAVKTDAEKEAEKAAAKAKKTADAKAATEKRKADNAANAKIVADRKQAEKDRKAAEKAAAAIVEPQGYILPEMYKIDSYEEAAALATELAKRGSNSNFELGWLALGVKPKYGEKTIAHLAKDASLAAATLSKLRWVASYWSPEDVARFPELTFSHFQAVTKVAVNRGKEEAMELLYQAVNGDGGVLSVEALNKLANGGKQPTKKDTLTVAGVHYVVIRSMEDFQNLFKKGRVFIGGYTDLDGEYEKSAEKAGLPNGIAKLTLKSTLADPVVA